MTLNSLTPQEIKALDQLDIEDELINKENELCEKEDQEVRDYAYAKTRELIDDINLELAHNFDDPSSNKFANEFTLLNEVSLPANVGGSLRSKQFIGGEAFVLYGAIYISDNKAEADGAVTSLRQNIAFLLKPAFAASFTHLVITYQDAQRWFLGLTETINDVFSGEINQVNNLIEVKKREVKAAQNERAFLLRGNKSTQVW